MRFCKFTWKQINGALSESRHQIKEFVLNFIKCEMQANGNSIKTAKASFLSALRKGSLLVYCKALCNRHALGVVTHSNSCTQCFKLSFKTSDGFKRQLFEVSWFLFYQFWRFYSWLKMLPCSEKAFKSVWFSRAYKACAYIS